MVHVTDFVIGAFQKMPDLKKKKKKADIENA